MNLFRWLSISVALLGGSIMLNVWSDILRSKRINELTHRIEALENAQGIRHGAAIGQGGD
jgi:hypothetical protein